MRSAEPQSWQLGHYDSVPKHILVAAGDTDLETVIADADTSMIISGLLDRAPTEQWRIVRDDTLTHGRATRREVWAAPAGDGTWWVLTATHVEGVRRIGIDPDTRTPLPSRKDRRAGLELEWASTATTLTESDVLRHEFEFVLRNTSEDAWLNIAGDISSITIVTSVEPRFYVEVGDERQLPTLPAGASVPILSRISEPLSVGTYQATAILTALNLATSSAATLTVVAGCVQR
ncbi:hypothetical protein C7458_12712 [Williamsia muralis]|nr:hypothetical protein C7458_12712 [Williamsia marianensis]